MLSSLLGFEYYDNNEQLMNDTKPSIILGRSNSGVRSHDYYRTGSAAHLDSVAVVNAAAAVVVGVVAVLACGNDEVRLS